MSSPNSSITPTSTKGEPSTTTATGTSPSPSPTTNFATELEALQALLLGIKSAPNTLPTEENPSCIPGCDCGWVEGGATTCEGFNTEEEREGGEEPFVGTRGFQGHGGHGGPIRDALKDVRCTICGVLRATPKNLKRHLKDVHGVVGGDDEQT